MHKSPKEEEKKDEHLLITTSVSSVIEQFSFAFILRRFDGDALSIVIETELVRLAANC